MSALSEFLMVAGAVGALGDRLAVLPAIRLHPDPEVDATLTGVRALAASIVARMEADDASLTAALDMIEAEARATLSDSDRQRVAIVALVGLARDAIDDTDSLPAAGSRLLAVLMEVAK